MSRERARMKETTRSRCDMNPPRLTVREAEETGQNRTPARLVCVPRMRRVGCRPTLPSGRDGVHCGTTMENLFRDLGQAFRGLRRSPGFTVVALLTLAIGLGATMAIFSVVDAVLLRPLPYPDSERIVRLWSIYSQRDLPPLNVSDGEYFDYREQSQAFEALGVHVSLNANLTGEGEPERVLATYTSAGFFPALGTQPALGRAYGADEDGPQGQPVAVISHGLWRRRFGASPGIVGGPLATTGPTAPAPGAALPPASSAAPSKSMDAPRRSWE